MTIDFLKAGNGDCIHLYGDGHHVIIDSGERCEQLRSIISDIKQQGEAIDLLVISHYDSDHIKEINNILSEIACEGRKKLVRKVWFNATKVGLYGNEKDLSATDATQLGTLLLEADIPWISELKKGAKEVFSESFFLEVLYGGDKYTHTRGGGYLSNIKNDWGVSMEKLETYLDDEALDTSATNAQSIILVVTLNGHRILLPGDSTPDKLSYALKTYSNGNRMTFDLIKLPHHGSYKNISKEILDMIECSDYFVSTDGSVYYHPNKKMILKVVKWGKRRDDSPFCFHMNYFDELYLKMGITQDEKQNYGFVCDGKRTFEF